MAENEPQDKAPDKIEPGSTVPSGDARGSRRKAMTPEMRRFLGPGRSWHDREAAKQDEEQDEESDPPPHSSPSFEPPRQKLPEERPKEPLRDFDEELESPKMPPGSPTAMPYEKLSQAIEMQRVA